MEHIHFSGGEFAGRHAVLEQIVEFGKGSTSWFGDSKVGVDDAKEACAAEVTMKGQYRLLLHSRGTYAQKKAVFFDQFHAVGLTM